MNEVMKVLTMISTIFIPLSFLAAVYGMNFEVLPELQWDSGYYFFWGISGSLALGMVLYFRRKKWF
jgi:magnesium transporter